MKLSLIRRQIEKRMEWRRHTGELARIDSMEAFEAYVDQVRPEYFLLLDGRAPEKRTEIQAVLEALDVAVEGQAVLDIGPGHGESLDVFHERRASEVHFIDYDPFFFTYNRLKGFTRGSQGNHFTKIRKLESDRFGFVWIKGSIRDDAFQRMGWLYPLGRWLKQVDRILAPAGSAVICPYWATAHGKRCQPDVQSTSLTATMLEHGYRILPGIRHHNSEPNYPVTYVKTRSDGPP